ncbi:MAG: molybdenum transporter, periplasmic molybdate-binding protein [Mycobacterium sp.]|nr:molybdenum transporter, periplasmic molybdate-binding protein [Mycobacterium sp.]
MSRTGRLGPVLGAAAALAALAGCGDGSTSTAASGTSAAGPSGTVTVDAAASLNQVFTALGKQFQAAHPGTTVRFNFGGSDTLAAQIVQGAPVDVFASASTTTMQTVTQANGTVGAPTTFATNTLEIATPPGNPKHLQTLPDLVAPGVKLDLCAPTVPCGAAATKAFAAATLTPHAVSEETDVTAVLTKVRLGEVDAGLVYRTDVQGARGAVTGVPLQQAAATTTTYPIALLTAGRNQPAAQAFIAYVTGPAGRSALSAAGFVLP